MLFRSNSSKKARFEYTERRVEKQLDAPPGVEDLANVLQQIQQVCKRIALILIYSQHHYQAVLYKITNRVEGVRHEVLRGRALMLEEAAADLVAMREERYSDCLPFPVLALKVVSALTATTISSN